MMINGFCLWISTGQHGRICWLPRTEMRSHWPRCSILDTLERTTDRGNIQQTRSAIWHYILNTLWYFFFACFLRCCELNKCLYLLRLYLNTPGKVAREPYKLWYVFQHPVSRNSYQRCSIMCFLLVLLKESILCCIDTGAMAAWDTRNLISSLVKCSTACTFKSRMGVNNLFGYGVSRSCLMYNWLFGS